VGYEGEAREPGGVEAGCADYYIDGVVITFMVRETIRCYGADGVGEDSRVGCNERFEIAWCWCWTAAPRIEVLRYHFLDKTGVVVEFVTHFRVGVFACLTGFFTAFDDEFETLVQFILNLFAVLEVFLGVFFEVFELLLAV
jgi:hypothetical protein